VTRDAPEPLPADEPAPDDAVRIETRRPTPLYRALARSLLWLEARARARGPRGLRRANLAVWLMVAAAGAFLFAGPVINEPRDLDDITSAASEASDRWIARSFDVAFDVERTDEGRMLMHVEERIDAVFPEGVDETGISRTIASHYEGHDLHPEVTGAEVDGAAVDVDVDHGATTTTFRWGTGEELRGSHEFVVRYTLADVAYRELDASTGRMQDLLEWDVFGPSWPQGVASTSATITVPRALEETLERSPRAAVAWTLLSDATSMSPDSETAETVTYVVDNDQTLPPHAQFWFTFRFAEGTFAMPDPAPLYWVLVVGPFVPLLLLAASLLFVLAARAVVWNDERGRAWYVAQYEPHPGVPAPVASRLMRQVLTSPLVEAAADARKAGGTPTPALARAAWRAGRPGDLLRAWRTYLTAPAWTAQFEAGLRRVPRGIVRDVFVGAALAFTLLQLGIVRQLSHQMPLSVYWWPFAIVTASVLLAATVLLVALTARPLTHAGALAREHLLGLRLYIEQTQLAGRTTLRDKLLPYIVMFSPPRRAGAMVRDLISNQGHRDARAAAGFMTVPRLLVRAVAVSSVAGVVLLAALVPSPSERDRPEDLAYSGDLPGGRGWVVSQFEADAQLERTGGGAAQIAVTETLDVFIEDDRDELPQVMRQWRDIVAGHDTDLEVTAVSVDGSDVPFEVRRAQGMVFLQTSLTEEWGGEHVVQVRYVVADAAAATQHDGSWREQVLWTALNEGWEWAWSWQREHTLERAALTIRIPAELAREVGEGSGWLDGQTRGETVVLPFPRGRTEGDDVVYAWQMEPEADGYWPTEANEDIGIRLLFAPGTFADVDQGSWWIAEAWRIAPTALALTLSILAAGAALFGLILRGGGVERLKRPGLLRDIVRWIPPWFAVAAGVVFVWRTADSVGEDPILAVVGIPAGIAVLLAVWNGFVTRRRR
jgi:hypothetical protein